MKRFLIAAVAALTFAAPAMAQSHGGYDGQPYRGETHARSYNGSGYGQYGGSYNRGPGYGYNDRSYNDRGYNARAERREWREDRQHNRRERRQHRGGNRYYGY